MPRNQGIFMNSVRGWAGAVAVGVAVMLGSVGGLGLLWPAAAAAQFGVPKGYRPTGADWQMLPLSGWGRMGEAELAQYNQSVPSNLRAQVGYSRQQGSMFAFVTQTPALPADATLANLTSREFIEGMKKGMASSFEPSTVLEVDTPVVDPVKLHATGSLVMTQDGARVAVKMRVFFGQRNSVTVAVSGLAGMTEQARSEVEAVFDAFAFDPGATFVPAAEGSRRGSGGGGRSGGSEYAVSQTMGRVFAGCLVLAGLLVVARKFKRS